MLPVVAASERSQPIAPPAPLRVPHLRVARCASLAAPLTSTRTPPPYAAHAISRAEPAWGQARQTAQPAIQKGSPPSSIAERALRRVRWPPSSTPLLRAARPAAQSAVESVLVRSQTTA